MAEHPAAYDPRFAGRCPPASATSEDGRPVPGAGLVEGGSIPQPTRDQAAAQGQGERVWKFALAAPNRTGRVFVDMPATARPISVGLQEGQMVVWALCDPEQEEEFDMQPTGPRRFIVANTGAPIPGFPDGARFLGTVTTDNGIVWHVWDGDARTTA